MYAQQANTGIAPLDAVLATAAMVTPEQTPTVAAQVAQAAQQKMQPQGIMGGMPQATQDFRTAAQIDNMKRMQMQQAMQQMAVQMTARPAGIEGLPAQNMQTFAAAQGGVVGYAGPTGSEVEVDETKLPVDERFKRKLRSIYEAIETDFMQRAGATPEMIARKLGKEPPAVPAPIPEGSDRRLNIPAGGIVSPGMTQETPAPRPPAPATRPPAAPAVPAAPQGGIAQLSARPTMDLSRYEKAGAEDRTSTQQIIEAQEANAAAKAAYMAGRPKFEQEGIAALTKANQAREELLAKERADDAYRRQQALLDQIGRRNLNAYRQEEDRQRQRDLMAAEAQRLYEQAVIKQREAEFLQGAGRFEEAKKALDDKEKLLSAMQTRRNQARQTEAGIAEREFAGAVQMYEGEQNREANRKLEEYRRQTALMKPRELEEIHRVERLKLNELTGGKPETATPQQKLEAIQFAHETLKGAGRAESVQARNRAEAYKRYAEWEKGPGEAIRMMNTKNPKVFEDAAKAKKREIYESLGLEIPGMGGKSGEEPPPNIKAILNKYGS